MTYITTGQETLAEWIFINKLNVMANKYTVEFVVPSNSQTAQDILAAVNTEWSNVSKGANISTAQSKGYKIVKGNDPKLTDEVRNRIDPNGEYMVFKGTQNANSKIKIEVYDSAATLITDPKLIGMIGDGSRVVGQLGFTGYEQPQKGVKAYLFNIQIIELVESKYAAMGPQAVEGGFIAPPQPVAPQVEVPQPEVQQMAAPAAPQAPSQQVSAPMAPQAPTAPTAPQVQQMAAPAAPMAPQAPTAPMAPQAQ